MTARQIVRTLFGKAHILVISLLLISFALSSASVPQLQTKKSAPAQSQTITRLSSGPAIEANPQNSNVYESGPENSLQAPVEAQNTATEPQQSISNMRRNEPTPDPSVAVTPEAKPPCTSACATPLPQPMPSPTDSCGCGGQTYYGYHVQHMCPMIVCAQ